MNGSPPPAEERTTETTFSFLNLLFDDCRHFPFAVRLWNGTVWRGREDCPPLFTMVINHPGALRNMFLGLSELSLGESYIFGEYDVEGDLDEVFPLVRHLTSHTRSIITKVRLARYLLALPSAPRNNDPRMHKRRQRGRLHSRERDASAIRYHYDVSNDFYSLWLDERMIYSCGYFQTPDQPLDLAQKQKLDYICRKLRLQPGEQLLDIGCGWGGLIIHASMHYGACATGITLSPAQAELVRGKIAGLGLGNRCRVEVCDYRELPPQHLFDKVASVGMFEHVGKEQLAPYFGAVWRRLRPGGVFLNHGIADNPVDPPPRGGSFMYTYVFPDGELVAIGKALQEAENCGFEVRDVESLREHYALTLRHWVGRLTANGDVAKNICGETIYRLWRLYMAGAAYAFDTGRINVYQAVLIKPDAEGRSGLPLTRADWYSGD